MSLRNKGKNNKKIILNTILTISLISGMSYYSYTEFNNFSKPIIEESPYIELASQEIPSFIWINDFLSMQPFDGGEEFPLEEWHRIPEIRTLLSDKNTCASPQPMPAYLIGYGSAENGSIQVNVAVTQTGMNKKIIYDLEERAKECDIDFKRVNENKVKIDDSTLFFYGDTIVSLVFNNRVLATSEERDDIENQTENRIRESLERNNCKSIETSSNDTKRNVFYTLDNDTEGYFVDEEIETSVEYKNLPILQEEEEKEIKYPNAKIPEQPLPKNFPKLPEKKEKPSLPALPRLTDETFTKGINYEVADINGAGCGWEWNGQQRPEYDFEKLKSDEEEKRTIALTEVNSNAGNYINEYSFSIKDRAIAQSEIVKWNEYVDEVNSVHERWRKLDDDRKNIKQSYLDYVDRYNMWVSFDTIKSNYEKYYNDKVEFCKDKLEKRQKWVDDGSPSSKPEPVICGTLTKPSILNEDRGDKPTFNLPENVTIPDSWEKPGENVDDMINKELSKAIKDYNSLIEEFNKKEKEVYEDWYYDRNSTTTTTTTTQSPRNNSQERRLPSPQEIVENTTNDFNNRVNEINSNINNAFNSVINP